MYTQIKWEKIISTAIMLLVLANGSFGPLAPSRSSAQDIQNETILFLGDNNYAPYEFIEDGKPAGANVDLLNAVGNVLGNSINIRLMSWSEAQKQVLEGKRRALTFMSKNEERLKLYDFTEPAFSSAFSFFTQAENASSFDIKVLSDKRIGVHPAGFPNAFLTKNHPEATYVLIENDLDGFGKLLRGEIDAVATNKWVGYYTLKKHGLSSISSVAPPFAQKTASIAVPKGNPDLVQRLNQAIRELNINGDFARIVDKWSGKKVVLFEQREIWLITALFALAFLLLILLIVMFFILKSRRESINHTAKLHLEIKERKHVDKALEKARDRADEANKAKSEFLASMSHELRTPLNAVIGFSQMLQIDPKNPLSPAQNENVENILDGGKHLLELVNEILDLAKIEADQLDLSLENVAANEIVADCMDMTIPLGEPRGIKIVDQFSGGYSKPLRTDPMRLKQVLLNLLSNAIKFNKEGGTVTVAGHETDDGFLHISVSDTGVGIAKKDYSGVFQVFHRLGTDPMVAQEGTGIGLTVTKQLVERMAGRIGFESEEGAGSTFWIELPLISNEYVIIWDDSLSVGVDVIDKDHQGIIKLINKVAHQAVNDSDLEETIKDMIAYTYHHFRREEAIMKYCGYPDLEKHISRHRGLVRKVDDMADTWRKERTPETLQHLQRFLQDWWTSHILKVDTGILQYTVGKEREIQKAQESFL